MTLLSFKLHDLGKIRVKDFFTGFTTNPGLKKIC
jgi:hypothetical protein